MWHRMLWKQPHCLKHSVGQCHIFLKIKNSPSARKKSKYHHHHHHHQHWPCGFHSFTYSPTHLILLFTQSLKNSFMSSFKSFIPSSSIYSFTQEFTHSLTHLLKIYSLRIHSFSETFIHHSRIHSLKHSVIHLCIHSFTCFLMHLLIHLNSFLQFLH